MCDTDICASENDEPLSDHDDYYVEEFSDQQSREEEEEEEELEQFLEETKKWLPEEEYNKSKKEEQKNNEQQEEEVPLECNKTGLESEQENVKLKEWQCWSENQSNAEHVFENISDLQEVIKCLPVYKNLSKDEVESMSFTCVREKCMELFNVEHPFVVSMDVLLVRMSYLANEVSKVALLSEPASLLLLQKENWQPTEVLSAYFLNSIKTLQSVNLTEENAKHAVRFHEVKELESEENEMGNINNQNKMLNFTTVSIVDENVNAHDKGNTFCNVCGTELDTNVKMYCLEACRHTCCLDCWCAYLEFELNNNPVCLDIRCPYNNCNELISMDGYYFLLTQQYSERRKKYKHEEDEAQMQKQRDLIKHKCCKCLISSSSRIRWCPNPMTCNGIVFLPEKFSITQVVRCSLCCYEFCFQCGREKHTPATCEMIGDWENILLKAVHSECWIVNNCQRCPDCNKTFERISGCDHMTCNCGAEFCWRCGRLFEDKSNCCCKCSKEHVYSKTLEKESSEDLWRRTYLQNSYVEKYKKWKAVSSQLLVKINDIKQQLINRTVLSSTESVDAAQGKLECLQQLHEELRLASSAMLHNNIFQYFTADTITATRQKCMCDKLEERAYALYRKVTESDINKSDVNTLKLWIESLKSKVKAIDNLQS